jgi:hypothetical protein
MSCHAWQQLLQQHLDGACDSELEHHLQTCPDCAVHQPALRRLLDGIVLLAPSSSPIGLMNRISEQLFVEARRLHRQRRRRLLGSVGILAAAAALLLAVGIRSWWSKDAGGSHKPDAQARERENPLPPDSSHPRENGAKPLRDSLAQAGTAVATLTSRAASETMDQTSSLLPLLPAPRLEPTALETAPMEPLREASAGVSAGLAPVTDSARRAVGLFLRDLPMGRNGG